MESIGLSDALRKLYDDRISFIREKNIELEREYFSNPSNRVPMSEIMLGASYEDHIKSYKKGIKNGTDTEISQIFILLQEYFLFSKGYDMMFKMKLKADIYTSVPIEDFIYPKLEEAVKEKYNDISVMQENPNFNANVEGIDHLVFVYTELQSLLYLLYYYDFQFPNGWEEICPDTYEEILDILKRSGMTIGDFLHALIDFKCKTMNEIFDEIKDPQLRKTYLEKVEKLRGEKHEETKWFAHVELPITYFLDHTFTDYLRMDRKSPILEGLEGTTPNGTAKIILPKNYKKDSVSGHIPTPSSTGAPTSV